jgi:hypothetical protein
MTAMLCNDKQESSGCLQGQCIPTGLWQLQDPTHSRQMAHGWQCGCQPYASASHPPFIPLRILVLICYRVSRPHSHNESESFWSTEKSTDLSGKQTCNHPACSTVSQPTTLLYVLIFVWTGSTYLRTSPVWNNLEVRNKPGHFLLPIVECRCWRDDQEWSPGI